MASNTYITPYQWKRDTYDRAGRRPTPYFPQGWMGWDQFSKQVSQVERAEKVKADAEKADARRQRLIKRGGDPDASILK